MSVASSLLCPSYDDHPSQPLSAAPPPLAPNRLCWQATCMISSWSCCRSSSCSAQERCVELESSANILLVLLFWGKVSSYWRCAKQNNIKCSSRELWHSATTMSHLQEHGHFSLLRSREYFSLSQWHGYYFGHLISSNKIDLSFQAVLESLCQ